MSARFLAGLFVLLALFQWWWDRYLAIGGIAPSWYLVATVAVASLSGPVQAQLLGFGWGLCVDAMGVHLFGANALALSLVGFAVGRGRKQVDLVSAPAQVLLVAAVSVMYPIVIGLLGTVFLGRFPWPGWAGLVGIPLANGAAAPFVFAILRSRVGRHYHA